MVKENTDLAFFVPVFQREVTHGLGANTNLLSLLNLITILSANRYPTCILERHSQWNEVEVCWRHMTQYEENKRIRRCKDDYN